MKRCILLFGMLWLFCLPLVASADEKTIRIGCVLPPSSISYGTTVHDYYARSLDELAKYTSWNYRLIDVSAGIAVSALERGALDILLPIPERYKQGIQSGFIYAKLPDSWDTFPIYAAAMPHNAPLLQEMSSAVETMVAQNQGYELSVLRENYLRARRPTIRFSAAEADYIDSNPPLRAVIYCNRPPYTNMTDEGTAEGIYPDILRELGRISGLRFTFVSAPSYTDAMTMLREGAADVLMDVYINSDVVKDFLYTQSIYAEEYSFVAKKDAPLRDNALNVRLAGQIPPINRYISRKFASWQIENSPSVKHCFDSISRGEADLAAVDSLTLQVRHSLTLFPSLSVTGKYSLTVPRCIAISPRQPPLLQSILNKSIMRLGHDKIEQTVMKHTGETAGEISFEYILYYYPLYFGLTVAFILLLATGLTFFVQYSRHMKLQQMILAEKNEALIDTLNALAETQAEKDSYKYRSETDALTGVFNKAAIENFARNALKILIPDTTDAIFIIDLDHFKEANDTRGHQYGDMVLVNFAKSLKKIVREGDAVGRFGGDEFVLYRRRADARELPLLAERIRAAAHALDTEQSPPITASIGVSCAPDNGTEYEELFRAADRALYYVKEHGRDNYRMAAPQKK